MAPSSHRPDGLGLLSTFAENCAQHGIRITVPASRAAPRTSNARRLQEPLLPIVLSTARSTPQPRTEVLVNTSPFIRYGTATESLLDRPPTYEHRNTYFSRPQISSFDVELGDSLSIPVTFVLTQDHLTAFAHGRATDISRRTLAITYYHTKCMQIIAAGGDVRSEFVFGELLDAFNAAAQEADIRDRVTPVEEVRKAMEEEEWDDGFAEVMNEAIDLRAPSYELFSDDSLPPIYDEEVEDLMHFED